MIINLITVLLFVIYSTLILYYRQGWISIPENDYKEISFVPKVTITVIIPARNEEANIGLCINSILSQTYADELFEIIVVDDFSTDNTAAIVRSYSNKNIKLIFLKDFLQTEKVYSYKKKAIEIAISKAKGELIVTTDADCIVPPEWLATISFFYEKHQPVFIAAPVSYYFSSDRKQKLGTKFLKIFQALDFLTLQGITGAAVYKKFHFMCNGANLAYEKKVFYEVGGFKEIDSIASGDDMLLMHKIVKRHPEKVLFLKSPNAVVKTKPAETLKDFFFQRIRWAGKSDKYSDKKIFPILIIVYLFNVWILVLSILAFFSLPALYWLISLMVAKTIIELFFLYPVAEFFKVKRILWWFPVAQPFHIIYTIIAGWLSKFGSYQWKGRKVNDR